MHPQALRKEGFSRLPPHPFHDVATFSWRFCLPSLGPTPQGSLAEVLVSSRAATSCPSTAGKASYVMNQFA